MLACMEGTPDSQQMHTSRQTLDIFCSVVMLYLWHNLPAHTLVTGHGDVTYV